ncbi:MAG: hypothetical protein JNK72_22440 [Myxococcales bacterium]|nr:hypothetical protein [Myxococcales bacterium]
MHAPTDPMARSRALLCEAMGLVALEHSRFERVDAVWRAVFFPAFHDVVAVTLSDIGVGGWVEVRAADLSLREATLAAAGMRPPVSTPPAAPGVWEATVKAAMSDAALAAMPNLPLHSVPVRGRDGVWIAYEAKVGQTVSRFSAWSPNPREAPLHYAIASTLCQVAVACVGDPVGQRVLHAIAPYLR